MSLIPEKNGIPLIKWSEYMHRLPTEEELGRWAIEYPDSGVGLVCGEVSGIVGLDIDSDEEEAFIMRFIPNAENMRAKRGSKGRTIFFKYNGEASKSWKKEGKVVCELLSDKRKTTIPPSIHRTSGKRYIWINEGAPLEELPAALLSGLDALYPQPKREIVKYPIMADYDRSTLEDAQNMLQHLDSDCTREEWLCVGMGLRDEYGDAAFGLWDDWSAGSSKYKQREMNAIWRSFNGSGYTIATVVYLAQQAGYIRQYENAQPIAAATVDLSTATKAELEERKKLVAHGLVGEIADWITETATRPQPQLALGAALSFVGMVKGHKYETVTQLRSNIYTMNIAPSGGGKDDPLKALDMLAEATGLENHLLAEPTAGTSLLRGLKDDAQRVGLWAIDEFGRYLSHVTNKNSGGYQKEIIDYLIKMFGRASGTMLGKKYANEKLNPRINIVNPHLCVIGASVKEHIIDNCTSKDAIDGFLNRWVLFESTDRPRMKIGKKRVAVPQSIIKQVQKMIDDNPNGIYPIEDEQKPIVNEVRYTPEAWAMVQQYQEDVEDLIDRSSPVLQALYTRTYEHTTKLALILSDNEFIRVEDVTLAVEIVTESNKLIVDLTGLISDNEQEKMVNKVLQIVKAHKGIKHADLIRRSKFLNAKARTEILNDLVQSGEIIAEKSGKTYIYT